LVYQASSKTVYKVVAGIAFRNPSAYEAYYDDNGVSQVANPGLRPETIHTLEASVERKISKSLNLIATVYQYWLSHLIEAVPAGDGLVQYQNVSRYGALGAEVEMNGRAWKGLEWTASIASADLDKKREVVAWPPNSPELAGKLRLALPVDHGRFTLSGALQYLSSRRTFAGEMLPRVYLADFTVTSSRLHPEFDVQFGIRNLFDQSAWDPASPGQGLDRLLRDGRSAFVKLIWHTPR
jgi:iron complex outermembrane receptor protein